MKNISYLVFFFALSCIFFACDDNDDKQAYYPPAKEVSIVDTIKADTIRTYYRTFLEQIAEVENIDIEAELKNIKYDVVFSTVEYEVSDPFGKIKTLSGLVGYPVLSGQEELHIASVQHGTIALESQAPSKSKFSPIEIRRDILSLVIPSHKNGYALAMPDYFGYGSDEKNQHYYEHHSSLAAASRGLIEDLPGYFAKKNITVNTDKAYLFGYSEGGFATMSTLKSFSEDSSSQFQDFVTVAGAGAYDKEMSSSSIGQQTTGESPKFAASYVWVILTYNSVYNINKKLDELFQAEIIPEVEKFTKNDSIMLAQFPAEPDRIFNPEFTKGLAEQSDKEFTKAFRDNNISSFQAKGNLSLIHGGADTWVPTVNTDSTYVRLLRRGVTVDKTIVPGGTHATTYPLFIMKVFKKL